ncbi:hypothetical protein [Methylopila sp. M107]|uniref:hypothetical protein n=1 Tax=Methylopila sp. M107 TaxID=1101190 RepID=UPI0012DFB283|nr:hypothetical protein [Methylopila sp. M107]
MPYLISLKNKSKEITLLAASAIEALVLIETYSANGYSRVGMIDTGQNVSISIEDLKARAESGHN